MCVQGRELGQGLYTVQSRRTAHDHTPTIVDHGGGEGGALDIGKHSTTKIYRQNLLQCAD